MEVLLINPGKKIVKKLLYVYFNKKKFKFPKMLKFLLEQCFDYIKFVDEFDKYYIFQIVPNSVIKEFIYKRDSFKNLKVKFEPIKKEILGVYAYYEE